MSNYKKRSFAKPTKKAPAKAIRKSKALPAPVSVEDLQHEISKMVHEVHVHSAREFPRLSPHAELAASIFAMRLEEYEVNSTDEELKKEAEFSCKAAEALFKEIDWRSELENRDSEQKDEESEPETSDEDDVEESDEDDSDEQDQDQDA